MLPPLHHIGIAVPNLEAAKAHYRALWEAEITPTEQLPERGLELCFVKPATGCLVELLAPLTPDSTIGKFLAKRGTGIHHLCYEVKDVSDELRRLIARGVVPIDNAPRPGASGHLVAFLDPKSTDGVLVELLQHDPSFPNHP